MEHGRLTLPSILVLTIACGPSIEATDGGADGSATASSVSADDASLTADSTDGGDGLLGSLGTGHGVVKIRLQRSPDADGDPFVGTSSVEITLLYIGCLVDFYEANPSWRQVGPDGSAVFQAALGTGLCDSMDPEQIACTVTEIQQVLDATKSLTVRYDVTGLLEGGELHVGPIPSQELASCADGELPIMRIGSTSVVRGLDAAGNTTWTTEAFSPPEAAVDQDEPLYIRALQI